MSTDTTELFYVLDARAVVGNCCSWWRAEGKGYTCDLADAGVYTAEQMANRRESDVLVPVALARSLVLQHVRSDHLQQHMDVRIGMRIETPRPPRNQRRRVR